MAEEKAEKVVEEKKEEKNVVMALLCYLGILIIIPLVTEAKKEQFVKFHIKQGIILLIGFVISSLIIIVPVLGWILGPLLWLFCVVLGIIGIVNALTGKEASLPLVGQFADKIKI